MSQWQHLIDKHHDAIAAVRHITPAWTSDEELAWLAEWASKRSRILEIGTHKGRSALVMARSTKGQVVCFDKCPDEGVEEFAKATLRDEPNVILIHQDAGVSGVQWQLNNHQPFDMIWIDDGHTYPDVVRDCLIAVALRRSFTSLICGHDYERPFNDVARAVNDCFGEKNIHLGPGSIWCL